MTYYCIGINTIILLSESQLGTLFASDASFWCYININEMYIKKHLYSRFPIVEITHSLSAKTVLPHLDKIFSIFGWFKHFLFDQSL